MGTETRKISKRTFTRGRRKTVNLSQQKLIEESYLDAEDTIPMIRPGIENLDLVDWIQANHDLIEQRVSNYGALFFRGFDIATPDIFERFALAVCSSLYQENGEHVPVSANGHVQTPVAYSSDKRLLWHNENSFNFYWPTKILFGCARPADRGGETTLVDSRRVLERIDPAVREAFQQKQVMYVRNYSRELGLDWQTVFKTTDKAEVERVCQETGIKFEWKDGDRLKTVAVRPAVIPHPTTGEAVWFNQAQHWHIACLDPVTRESLLALYEEDDLPRSCYFGDGDPIEDSVMQEICEIYEDLELSLPWQRGDVIVVDNVLLAHGRNAFDGERRILVALGDMDNYQISR